MDIGFTNCSKGKEFLVACANTTNKINKNANVIPNNDNDIIAAKDPVT